MDVNPLILEGTLRGCMSVLESIRNSDQWAHLPPDVKDDLSMAIREARESLGESPSECEEGACRI